MPNNDPLRVVSCRLPILCDQVTDAPAIVNNLLMDAGVHTIEATIPLPRRIDEPPFLCIELIIICR